MNSFNNLANKNHLIKSLKNQGIFVDDLKRIKAGSNSQSFYIEIKNEKRILKFYPSNDHLKRDRLGIELSFLQFLKNYDIKNVPSPILWDKSKGWMILSWLEGKPIKIIKSEHIKLLVNFILELDNLKYKNEAKYLKNASEACFDINSHINSTRNRFLSIRIFLKDFNYPEVRHFNFFTKFIQYIDDEIKKIKSNYSNSSLNNELGKKLNQNKKILSQSDVGFHNIFLLNNSELQFFDFEYAGWDDPHKLISDLILQPDNNVPLNFLKNLQPLIIKYVENRTDIERILLVMSIYRIKWLLIIFNKVLKNDINKINLDEISKKLTIYRHESNNRLRLFKKFIEYSYC